MTGELKERGGLARVRGTACPGCGAVLRDPRVAMSPPIAASAGCWAAYGDVVGREYSEWANPPVHRLTAATYAAQHPGERTDKAVLSVAVHLVALHFMVERGIEAGRVPREIGRAVADPSEFRWLEPPVDPTWQTIADVRGARDVKEHTGRVHRWARSVWEAWSPHHDVIRKWSGR
ncbi:MAG TPA: DUF5946 family protein [Longimicrobiales bacterium]|nr:DUF5946 family protein [Longimicrobiales bacterium]